MTWNRDSMLKWVALGLSVTFVIAIAFGFPSPSQSQDGLSYEVTVTNLTRGQQFTPILVATHTQATSLFMLGSPSTPELATLAQEGNNGPLASLLSATPGVRDVQTSSGMLNPGASTTMTVKAGGRADHISVAAMLVPTNDGFFAVNNVELPKGNVVLSVFSPAYDAGAEQNDELCASIPGPSYPECGGPGGGGMAGGGEGYVYIHEGIHGVGNFSPAQRDWRNPVAKIVIQRTR